MRCFLTFSLLFHSVLIFGQLGTIKGQITDGSGNIVSNANVSLENTHYGAVSNSEGKFVIKKIAPGPYSIQFSAVGFEAITKKVHVNANEILEVNFETKEKISILNEVKITGIRTITGMGYLDEVHDGAIFSGKKTEVLLLDSLDANTAQNNPRQVLGRIPGANYSETEGSGFPSHGIGFRGLNPTQSIETNTRQNGYNITADLYGYPESYYLPPLEAVERIEVIRGAASLQYGPQFGGVINYILKKGIGNKPLEITTQQTVASFGVFNSFISAGGQLGKFNYYAFGQFQTTEGWRPNSDNKKFSGFARLEYAASEKIKIGLEYTFFRNKIHMPGGLTDSLFQIDSKRSTRARNWIKSPWNILTATLDYKISPNSSLSFKSASNLSSRSLVWKNDGPQVADEIDPATGEYTPREVELEKFISNTTEARVLTNYPLGKLQNTLVSGVRFFSGEFEREEGEAGTTGSDFDFTSVGEAEEEEEEFEYELEFTTVNLAAFVENTFRLGKGVSITPGIRYEYLTSKMKGYIPKEGEDYSNKSKSRSIFLAGIGAQIRTSASTNIYANFSQAYRPIDYSSLTPLGTIASVDPDLKDSKGYNADFGFRGSVDDFLNFDIGGFFLSYKDRIGILEREDGPFKTNIADSEHSGLESYVEFNLIKFFAPRSNWNVSFFNSLALINAKYVTGEHAGKYVEYAPKSINRLGVTLAVSGFSNTFLISSTGKSFGDADNLEKGSEDAVAGPIPSYTVMDWSGILRFKNYNLKFGVNNLSDKRYFTKRTEEYPGPGIIPSIGRSIYVGIGAKF